MTPSKQELIRRNLRLLAANYAAMMDLMDKTFSLLCDEAASDPLDYWQSIKSKSATIRSSGLVVDTARLTVTYRGRTCFLGNTLPFKLLSRLAECPNSYVSHRVLLDEVWEGIVSVDAMRSVVKVLRSKLREQRLSVLADAIDGKTRGHYTLRLPAN